MKPIPKRLFVVLLALTLLVGGVVVVAHLPVILLAALGLVLLQLFYMAATKKVLP